MAAMKRTYDLSFLCGMFHDHVTSGLPDHLPAISLQQPDQLTGFHFNKGNKFITFSKLKQTLFGRIVIKLKCDGLILPFHDEITGE